MSSFFFCKTQHIARKAAAAAAPQLCLFEVIAACLAYAASAQLGRLSALKMCFSVRMTSSKGAKRTKTLHPSVSQHSVLNGLAGSIFNAASWELPSANIVGEHYQNKLRPFTSRAATTTTTASRQKQSRLLNIIPPSTETTQSETVNDHTHTQTNRGQSVRGVTQRSRLSPPPILPFHKKSLHFYSTHSHTVQ